jgi:hypothetical protein
LGYGTRDIYNSTWQELLLIGGRSTGTHFRQILAKLVMHLTFIQPTSRQFKRA